jgi:4-hydroxymandelate oxidase
VTNPDHEGEIPSGVVCLADYERLAAERLDANAWAYFAGGAGDQITLRANRDAFDRTALLPRVLRPCAGGSTRLELLGRSYAHPIMVGPVAYQKLAHPGGECATAIAASALDAGMVVSSLATQSLEEIAAVAGPRRWLQLYLHHDRTHTLDLTRRAEAAGYEALVVTVDAPVSGVRNEEQRVGFHLPPGLSAVNTADYPPPPPPRDTESLVFDYFMRIAPGWDDVGWLAGQTQLPVLIKGILHPDDAELAIGHGAAGLIVSNHGGRTLDTVPATIDVLPAIAARVGQRVPILMDGGIRRGTDVFKAIALGADAVLIGRPIVFGLAVAGPRGVAHVLRLLRDELEIAMALCGCRTLADIDREHVLTG